MHVVTVSHMDAYWIMAYGPFDEYLDAQKFAMEKMKAHRLRVNVLAVCDPDEG